jgi:hypothetical protein
LVLIPAKFCTVLLSQLAPGSELVWTKGLDKLSTGVIHKSHKKLWYEFPMGSQGPSKHREGKEGRDKQGGEKTEGASVPKGPGRMFAMSCKDRRGNLTPR